MPSCTVLVIEDDAAIRRGLVDALSYAGYGVLECDNGQAGIEGALSLVPDTDVPAACVSAHVCRSSGRVQLALTTVWTPPRT